MSAQSKRSKASVVEFLDEDFARRVAARIEADSEYAWEQCGWPPGLIAGAFVAQTILEELGVQQLVEPTSYYYYSSGGRVDWSDFVEKTRAAPMCIAGDYTRIICPRAGLSDQKLVELIDINAAQVGIHMETTKLVYTEDFLEFLQSGQARIVRWLAPIRSLLHLVTVTRKLNCFSDLKYSLRAAKTVCVLPSKVLDRLHIDTTIDSSKNAALNAEIPDFGKVFEVHDSTKGPQVKAGSRGFPYVGSFLSAFQPNSDLLTKALRVYEPTTPSSVRKTWKRIRGNLAACLMLLDDRELQKQSFFQRRDIDALKGLNGLVRAYSDSFLQMIERLSPMELIDLCKRAEGHALLGKLKGSKKDKLHFLYDFYRFLTQGEVSDSLRRLMHFIPSDGVLFWDRVVLECHTVKQIVSTEELIQEGQNKHNCLKHAEGYQQRLHDEKGIVFLCFDHSDSPRKSFIVLLKVFDRVIPGLGEPGSRLYTVEEMNRDNNDDPTPQDHLVLENFLHSQGYVKMPGVDELEGYIKTLMLYDKTLSYSEHLIAIQAEWSAFSKVMYLMKYVGDGSERYFRRFDQAELEAMKGRLNRILPETFESVGQVGEMESSQLGLFLDKDPEQLVLSDGNDSMERVVETPLDLD